MRTGSSALLAVAVTLSTLAGCDPAYGIAVAVEVPVSIQQALPSYPRELRYRADGRIGNQGVFLMARLCGATPDAQVVEMFHSSGIGPEDVTVTAWVTAVTTAAGCGALREPVLLDPDLGPSTGDPSASARVRTSRGDARSRLVVALP